jgi:Mrp family chromosome partitioning ATPase/capsular polysaccharide biosynthesis protein
MTPTEYLTIVRRHWKLVVGLVVVAAAIVFWTSPDTQKASFESTHTLLVETDQGRGGGTEVSPQVVALYTTKGEVPVRAAAALDFDGSPAKLADKVTAVGNRELGTVDITATDRNPERAAEIADTFAKTVEDFLTEKQNNTIAEAQNENTAKADQLKADIATLDGQIAADPANTSLAEQRAGLVRQLTEVQAADPSADLGTVRFTTLQAAPVGTQQSSLPGTRSREQRMVLAALVALVLGFGLAIALDRSDTRIRTRQAAEAHFGLPVLAEIPNFSLPARRRKLVVADEPDSVKAEAFRTLRSAIMLVHKHDGETSANGNGHDAHAAPAGAALTPEQQRARHLRRPTPDRAVILVTSPGPGEGKTTTSANLAAAYAETGASVLVLSCDLWRSSVARHFGTKLGRGVSDLLSADGEVRLADVVHDTSTRGVSIVTAGLAVRRPGGRLVAEQRMIDEARHLADIVIVDTAPVLSAALTRELATMVDALVVVCRVGRTTATEADRCADLLSQLRAPALGLALVGVATSPFYDYFSYSNPRRGRRERAWAETDVAGGTVPPPVNQPPDPSRAP